MGFGGRGQVRFGDFEFDLLSGKLFRGGRPVKIQPQPLRVLAVLLERAGEIVTRECLRTRVWGDANLRRIRPGSKLLHPANPGRLARRRFGAALY